MSDNKSTIKRFSFILSFLVMTGTRLFAQVELPPPVIDSNELALKFMKEQRKKWGVNDTIVVPAIFYQNEIVNFKEESMVWISKLSPDKLAKFIEEWTRLRNAVYVTYPFARIAGGTINDINKMLTNVASKKERKSYIKSREKEFQEQMKQLSQKAYELAIPEVHQFTLSYILKK